MLGGRADDMLASMPVAQHAIVVAIFLGGCLTGAAVLSLSAERTQSAESAKRTEPAKRQALPPESELDGADSADVVADHPEPLHDDPVAISPEPEEPESTTSAADVLAYLEAEYQQRLSAASRTEPPAEISTQVTTSQVTPQGAEPSPTVENVVEVQVEVAQAETQDERKHTQVHGDVYQGDVHQGDVNQVQQVAVLNYQPIVVLPSANVDAAPLPRARAQSRHSYPPSIDPWAPVTISPRHDPWASAKLSPRHDPWRSSVLGKRP